VRAKVLSIILASCWAAGATEIPEQVIPQGVGVNIHFVTGQEKDLDLIAAAGFRFIRMDFTWAGIEKQKGVYDWSQYDQLMANLDRRGIHAMFILDYSNPLYEQNNASPQHPESVAAFAKWAAAAAGHYNGRHVIWEIWNEPNIGFWVPKPDAQQYAQLAVAVGKAIRAGSPQATLVAPACSTFDWKFMETVFKSGVLPYLDAVSMHPYRDPGKGPETAAPEYEKLRQLIAQYAPAGKKKLPILSGEWGYSTHKGGVSLDKQAAYAARQQLANLLSGVPLSIWYDWKNDGSDPNENEHNFGTVVPDLTPKASYTAVNTLTHELDRGKLERRVALADTNDFALVFSTPAGRKLAVWTTGSAHAVEIPIRSSKSPQVVQSDGQRASATIAGKNLVLRLEAAPQYVSGVTVANKPL
jgi:polysaccharide biosynthesis protein PslG